MIGRQVVLVKERDGLMPGSRGKVIDEYVLGFIVEINEAIWSDSGPLQPSFTWCVRADQIQLVGLTPVERYIMNELHNAP